MTWKLEGYDAFSHESYPLASFDSREAAFAAALDRLDELERDQPSASSGGQWGIQDRVFIINPDGTRDRIHPRPRFPQTVKSEHLLAAADVPFERLVKAARAALGWTQADLAEHASLGVSTVADFERSKGKTEANTINHMRRAIETAGVVFIPGGIWSKATGNVFLQAIRPASADATAKPADGAT